MTDPDRTWPLLPDGNETVGPGNDKYSVNRRLWHLASQGCVEQYHLILLDICVRTGKSALELGGDIGLVPGLDGTIYTDSSLIYRNFPALHYICDSIRSWEAESDTQRDESDLEMVKLLLANGADPAAQSAWNETPLLCAVRRNRPLIVEFLLEYPAVREIINVPDLIRKMTPLATARFGSPGLVSALVATGAVDGEGVHG